MLPADCPSALHFIVPFLQRANEMAEAQPVLAYYCKYYAVSLALKGGGPLSDKFQRSPQTDAFLAKLFDHLEAEKVKLSSHSTITELTQGAIYVRELAYRIFLSAEKQESAPETLKKSLQSYLAALNFLQVYRGIFLEDPGVLDLGEEERMDELGQVEEKSKFAKWRIVEIKKQFTIIKSSDSKISNFERNNSPTTTTNIALSQSSHLPGHHPTTPPIPKYQENPVPHTSPPVLLYDPKILSECEKHARHAISALNFDDIETAAKNLRTALKVLQPLLKED